MSSVANGRARDQITFATLFVATPLLFLGCLPGCVATNESLALELVRLGERDQRVRRQLVEHLQANPIGSVPAPLRAELSRVDDENLRSLKRIVRRHGWPRATAVGPEAARAAFLIVQHADADSAFQARMLGQMRPLVETGDVSPESYALLMDRVLVAQGEPQRYGTQYETVEVDGVTRLVERTPIQDPDLLEERRAAMGLSPHAAYVRQLRQLLGVPEE